MTGRYRRPDIRLPGRRYYSNVDLKSIVSIYLFHQRVSLFVQTTVKYYTLLLLECRVLDSAISDCRNIRIKL